MDLSRVAAATTPSISIQNTAIGGVCGRSSLRSNPPFPVRHHFSNPTSTSTPSRPAAAPSTRVHHRLIGSQQEKQSIIMLAAASVKKVVAMLVLLLSSQALVVNGSVAPLNDVDAELSLDAMKTTEAHRRLDTSGGPDYTYHKTYYQSEPYGPSEWHLGYEACNGTSQSPINLSLADERVARIDLRLYPASCDSAVMNFNPGDHFFKVGLEACPETPYLTFQGREYGMLQTHIHSISEHTMGATHHDAEVHLVHLRKGTYDDLLVIGVFLDCSRHGDNEVIEQLWNAWRAAEGCFAPTTNSSINFYDLLPPIPSFVTYQGSLTTPPCYEGVTWVVMTEPILMGEHQLEEYRLYAAHLQGSKVSELGDTNRPTQPRNGRTIIFRP